MSISPKAMHSLYNTVDRHVRSPSDALWPLLRTHNDLVRAESLLTKGQACVTQYHLLAAVFDHDPRLLRWLLQHGGDANWRLEAGLGVLDVVLHEHAANVRAVDITKITFAYLTRKCLYVLLKQEDVVVTCEQVRLLVELAEPQVLARMLRKYTGAVDKELLLLALHQGATGIFEKLVRRYDLLPADHLTDEALLAAVVQHLVMPVHTIQLLLRRGALANCRLQGVHVLELAYSLGKMASVFHLTVAGAQLSASEYARMRGTEGPLAIIDDFKAFVFLSLGFRTQPGRRVRIFLPRDVILLIHYNLARMVLSALAWHR